MSNQAKKPKCWSHILLSHHIFECLTQEFFITQKLRDEVLNWMTGISDQNGQFERSKHCLIQDIVTDTDIPEDMVKAILRDLEDRKYIKVKARKIPFCSSEMLEIQVKHASLSVHRQKSIHIMKQIASKYLEDKNVD